MRCPTMRIEDLRPHPYWVRENPLPVPLRDSLDATGILAPVAVVEDAGQPTVADGWRRVLWATRRGADRVPVVEVSATTAIEAALAMNAANLSSYERTKMVLDHLADRWHLEGWRAAGQLVDRLYRRYTRGQRAPAEPGDSDRWRDLLDLLRVAQVTPDTIRTAYHKILNKLPDAAHRLIGSGHLTAREALLLMRQHPDVSPDELFAKPSASRWVSDHFARMRDFTGGSR